MLGWLVIESRSRQEKKLDMKVQIFVASLIVLGLWVSPAVAQQVRWTQAQPSPRTGHAMAYDAGRGVTVLFGGGDSNTNNSETWEWNGGAWTRRYRGGPSPRFGHAMAYDAARGVTV